MSEHLSDLELDQLRLGHGTKEIERHLSDCAICQSRREILIASAEEFAGEQNIEALVDKTLQAAPRQPRRRHWARPVAAASAAVMLAAAAFLFAPDTTRTKGGGDEVELFMVDANGDPAKLPKVVPDNAQLSVRVTTASTRFVRLLWKSKPNKTDALYPSSEAPAWRIHKSTWLPHKITIKAAQSSEYLQAVVGGRDISHRQALAEVDKPTRCEVQSIEVKTQ